MLPKEILITKYLTDEEILEFQRLAKKCYNIDLTLEESESQALSMVIFLESLYKSDQNMMSFDIPVDTSIGKVEYGSK
jgi:hypothetical protein